MRLKQDVLKTVFYLGEKSPGSEFIARGTAFLIGHDNMVYLVTAKHVAEAFADNPFYLRMNRKEGPPIDFHYDPTQTAVPRLKWFFHPSDSVDVAIMPFLLDIFRENVDFLIISSDEAVDRKDGKAVPSPVGCGDLCYAVGLFSMAPGKSRNFPVIHTGHIARMSDRTELIPQQRKGWQNIKEVEGYIVQLSNLGGLSGAPVFIRSGAGIPLENGEIGLLPLERVDLLGVWSGSWEGPSAGSPGMRVPVGMGIVVPSERLVDLLNSEPVLANKKEWFSEATPTSEPAGEKPA